MRLVLSLFTITLAVIATFILVNVIVPHFSTWLHARNWVQVDTISSDYKFAVTKSEEKNTDGGIDVKYLPELNVNYSYSYKGKKYLGNKLVIDGVDPSDQYLYGKVGHPLCHCQQPNK